MRNTSSVVQQIIKRYGPVIDLRKDPTAIIDIIRNFGDVFDDDGPPDGGLPPGGAPDPPPAPDPPAPNPPAPDPPGPGPGPGGIPSRVSHDDIMREVLKLARAVDGIAKQIKPIARTPRTRGS